MKKVLISAALLISISIFSQGRRDKQSFINAQYGYILSKDNLDGGFMAKAGYGKLIGEKGLMGKGEVFYQDYKVNYIDNQILPYKNYGLSAMAGYSYEGLSPVFINVWLGAFGSYEIVNDGNTKDPIYNTDIPERLKGFTYGLTGSAELEIMLFRKLSLVADYTQYYDLKSKFTKSNFAFFGGLKYYIN